MWSIFFPPYQSKFFVGRVPLDVVEITLPIGENLVITMTFLHSPKDVGQEFFPRLRLYSEGSDTKSRNEVRDKEERGRGRVVTGVLSS